MIGFGEGKGIRPQEKRLFSNTVFLYLLTFSTQLFSFITVPYLSRVLGPTVFGKVGIAQAYMSYVQIILDFGLILSATQKVVENRENKAALGKLLTSVTVSKVLLSVLVSSIFVTYIFINPSMRGDWVFFVLFMIATIVNALMPDFFYRGIEAMKVITLRTFSVKGLCTAFTFVFVHTEQDYWMIPAFQLLGNILAVGVMYRDMANKHHVIFRKPDRGYTYKVIKDTLPFFISRAASLSRLKYYNFKFHIW